MTIIRGGHRGRRGSHRRGGSLPPLTLIVPAPRTSKRVGRKLGERSTIDHATRAAQPLTPLQQVVFDALTTEPQGTGQVAKAAGVRSSQASSALRYLQGKSRARRTAAGWVVDESKPQ